MFKIHQKVKYALTALKYMKARPAGELVTAKQICKAFGIPFDPTSRVLQLMTQHGVLEAVQGAHGGYRLVGDLGKLSIDDLNRMAIGPVALTDCTSGDHACRRGRACVLKDGMARLNARLVRVFKETSVSEMI